MKRSLFLAFAALIFAGQACKKDVTCECTSTSSGSNTDSKGNTTTYVNDPSTQTTTYKGIKKSKVGTFCGDTKYTDNYTSTSGNSTTSSSSTYEVKCKIK